MLCRVRRLSPPSRRDGRYTLEPSHRRSWPLAVRVQNTYMYECPSCAQACTAAALGGRASLERADPLYSLIIIVSSFLLPPWSMPSTFGLCNLHRSYTKYKIVKKLRACGSISYQVRISVCESFLAYSTQLVDIHYKSAGLHGHGQYLACLWIPVELACTCRQLVD